MSVHASRESLHLLKPKGHKQSLEPSVFLMGGFGTSIETCSEVKTEEIDLKTNSLLLPFCDLVGLNHFMGWRWRNDGCCSLGLLDSSRGDETGVYDVGIHALQ